MIFYEQNNQGIAFLLNEDICGEISNWNHAHLQLDRIVLPFFQLTLLKDESDAVCIEVEQLSPRSLEGNTFKHVYAARLVDSVRSTTSNKIGFPYLNPPAYKLQAVVLLCVDLVKYSHQIIGWQNWTSETALSGRYVYGFGEVYGDACEDGDIEDTVTGEMLHLADYWNWGALSE